MSDQKIVNMDSVRKEKQEIMRRETERVLFSRVLGCYCVIEKMGLQSIEVQDISKAGVRFRMSSKEAPFKVGEDVDLRFYFTNSSFLPCRITIKRQLDVEENHQNYWEFGGTFDTQVSTFEALNKFVDFIHAYSVAAKVDKGGSQVWFL